MIIFPVEYKLNEDYFHNKEIILNYLDSFSDETTLYTDKQYCNILVDSLSYIADSIKRFFNHGNNDPYGRYPYIKLFLLMKNEKSPTDIVSEIRYTSAITYKEGSCFTGLAAIIESNTFEIFNDPIIINLDYMIKLKIVSNNPTTHIWCFRDDHNTSNRIRAEIQHHLKNLEPDGEDKLVGCENHEKYGLTVYRDYIDISANNDVLYTSRSNTKYLYNKLIGLIENGSIPELDRNIKLGIFSVSSDLYRKQGIFIIHKNCLSCYIETYNHDTGNMATGNYKELIEIFRESIAEQIKNYEKRKHENLSICFNKKRKIKFISANQDSCQIM